MVKVLIIRICEKEGKGVEWYTSENVMMQINIRISLKMAKGQLGWIKIESTLLKVKDVRMIKNIVILNETFDRVCNVFLPMKKAVKLQYITH